VSSSEPPVADAAPEEVGEERRRRRRPILAVVVVIAVIGVAGGVGSFLFLTDGSNPTTEKAGPERGLACPSLQQAADAYEQGDLVAYNAAIDEALRVSQETLQISGQAFGEPERIALELGLSQHEDVPRFLTQASSACTRLGRWNAPAS